MGLPEEAGKIAGNLTEALKAQPVMLLVLLLNCLFFGLTFIGVQRTQERQHAETLSILDRCMPKGTHQ